MDPTEVRPTLETSPGLSIVIPVYNGASTIGRLVTALSQLSVAGGLEIILVYDGSPDDSLAVCQALAATATVPLTVIEHSKNYGEHNAVMTGFRHARGTYLITMDDDLQNPPEEVVRLYDACRLGGHEAVYGFYDDKRHAGWRNLGSRFNNWVADRLLEKPRGLYLCSFRCVSAFVARAITAYEGPFVYIDGLILQVTQKIGSLQVRHLDRAEGSSNYTLRRLIGLWLVMALSFSIFPLRLATLAGAVTGGLGILGLLATFLEGLLGYPPDGWASLAAITLALGGVQLLMLGIIGEYIGRLSLTANKRPQAVVKSLTHGGPRVS